MTSKAGKSGPDVHDLGVSSHEKQPSNRSIEESSALATSIKELQKSLPSIGSDEPRKCMPLLAQGSKVSVASDQPSASETDSADMGVPLQDVSAGKHHNSHPNHLSPLDPIYELMSQESIARRAPNLAQTEVKATGSGHSPSPSVASEPRTSHPLVKAKGRSSVKEGEEDPTPWEDFEPPAGWEDPHTMAAESSKRSFLYKILHPNWHHETQSSHSHMHGHGGHGHGSHHGSFSSHHHHHHDHSDHSTKENSPLGQHSHAETDHSHESNHSEHHPKSDIFRFFTVHFYDEEEQSDTDRTSHASRGSVLSRLFHPDDDDDHPKSFLHKLFHTSRPASALSSHDEMREDGKGKGAIRRVVSGDRLSRGSGSELGTSHPSSEEVSDGPRSEEDHPSRTSTYGRNRGHEPGHLHHPSPIRLGSAAGVHGNRKAVSPSEDSHGHTTERLKVAHRTGSDASLAEKYGKMEEVVGKGAFAIVRLAHKENSDIVYAVKAFRKRRKDETPKDYLKRVVAEFCISSNLQHENVIHTVDLIQDEHERWCQVMEYMSGGDLYTRINRSLLSDSQEINCYFRQLISGMSYLHSMGVAHRDLKPENLLLSKDCRILKISDFGSAEVFKTCFEKGSRKAKGLVGSDPYLSPEQYEGEYDPVASDIWAMGIIYYAMTYNAIPWRHARMEDPQYKIYITKRHGGNGGFGPIDRMHEGTRLLLYRILEPDVSKRITMSQIESDGWLQAVEVCKTGGPDPTFHRHAPDPRHRTTSTVNFHI